MFFWIFPVFANRMRQSVSLSFRTENSKLNKCNIIILEIIPSMKNVYKNNFTWFNNTWNLFYFTLKNLSSALTTYFYFFDLLIEYHQYYILNTQPVYSNHHQPFVY